MDLSGARCGGTSGLHNGRSANLLRSTTSQDQLVLFKKVDNPKLRPRVQALENVSGYMSLQVSCKALGDDDSSDDGSQSDCADEDQMYSLLHEHHVQMSNRNFTSTHRTLNSLTHRVAQSRERLYNVDIDKCDDCGGLRVSASG